MTTTPPAEGNDEARSKYTAQQTAAYFADKVERIREEYMSGTRRVRHPLTLDSVAAFLRRVATDDLDVFAHPAALSAATPGADEAIETVEQVALVEAERRFEVGSGLREAFAAGAVWHRARGRDFARPSPGVADLRPGGDDARVVGAEAEAHRLWDDAVERAARAARAHARGAPSNGSEDDHWRGVARAALDAAGVPALHAGFWPALAGENDRDAWRYAQERDEARVALAALREQAETALYEIDHSGAGTYLARQRLRAALADTAGAPRTDVSAEQAWDECAAQVLVPHIAAALRMQNPYRTDSPAGGAS